MSKAFNFAMKLYGEGNLRQAIPLFMQALDEQAEAPDVNVLYHVMKSLVAMRDYKGAAMWIEQLLTHVDELKTDRRILAEFYYNLACCHETLGNWNTARRYHLNSLAFMDLTLSKINLGSIAYRMGKPSEARQWHQEAIDVRTTDWEIMAGRSFVKLLHGDYRGGFREYESRLKVPSVRFQTYMPTWGKSWNGTDSLKGQGILVIAEQGLGDAIQMLRYVPMIQAQGARVTIVVQKGMIGWVQHSFPGTRVIAKGDSIPGNTRYWIHMMSLPHRFKTTVETIPQGPYMTAPEKDFGLPKGFRVGWVHQGNKLHMGDKDRSAPDLSFAPLFDVPVNWIHLDEQSLKTAHGVRDFADTASLLTQLDLVISIDSAVSHAAGALGVPCWLLPPCAPEWRWGVPKTLTQDRAPWYEKHRLFRREHVNAWPEVIQRVKAELQRLLAVPAIQDEIKRRIAA